MAAQWLQLLFIARFLWWVPVIIRLYYDNLLGMGMPLLFEHVAHSGSYCQQIQSIHIKRQIWEEKRWVFFFPQMWGLLNGVWLARGIDSCVRYISFMRPTTPIHSLESESWQVLDFSQSTGLSQKKHSPNWRGRLSDKKNKGGHAKLCMNCPRTPLHLFEGGVFDMGRSITGSNNVCLVSPRPFLLRFFA